MRRESSSDDDADELRAATAQDEAKESPVTPVAPAQLGSSQNSATSSASRSPFAYTVIKQPDSTKEAVAEKRCCRLKPTEETAGKQEIVTKHSQSLIISPPRTPQKLVRSSVASLETRSRSFPMSPDRLRMLASHKENASPVSPQHGSPVRSVQTGLTQQCVESQAKTSSTLALSREERLRLSRLKQEDFRRRQREKQQQQQSSEDAITTLRHCPASTPMTTESSRGEEIIVDQSLSLGISKISLLNCLETQICLVLFLGSGDIVNTTLPPSSSNLNISRTTMTSLVPSNQNSATVFVSSRELSGAQVIPKPLLIKSFVLLSVQTLNNHNHAGVHLSSSEQTQTERRGSAVESSRLYCKLSHWHRTHPCKWSVTTLAWALIQ